MLRRIGAVLIVLQSVVVFVQAAQKQEKPLFDPERSALYTQAELWRGFDASTGNPGWDAEVYLQYVSNGKFYPPRVMARAMSLHDDGISVALNDYIRKRREDGKEPVAVMGNALEDIRCTASYRRTALLGYELSRNDYLVVTGGGPGEMEAANLGAYLSGQNISAIDEAIGIMRARAEKNSDPTVCRYANRMLYTEAASDVLRRFPKGTENLGVPTWFYGHEPPNMFATRVAKYFSNAIREDMLLAVGIGGVVFTEGRAGMRQEIFQKATQDSFASFCYVSPMVFLGKKEFQSSGLYQLVYDYASPAFPTVDSYRNSLKLTDDVSEVVTFLNTNPPRRVDDAEGACKNMP